MPTTTSRARSALALLRRQSRSRGSRQDRLRAGWGEERWREHLLTSALSESERAEINEIFSRHR